MATTDSTLQIIPFYAQPHVYTRINDDTFYEETVAARIDPNDLPFATAIATGADRGIDNTWVCLNDKKVKTSIFGKANFNKYGQPSLQADVLFNGQTNVWMCRVLPDNATYANLIMMVKFRKGKVYNDANQETGLHRLEVQLTPAYANKPYVTEGATSDSVIEEVARSMASLTADPKTGYMTLPFFFTRSIGRGRYGNEYSISVSRDSTSEKEYSMKMYKFSLISNADTTKVVNQFSGSLFQTTKYDMSTLISDILSQFSLGSCPISITPFEDTIETLYSFYKSIVAENAAYITAAGSTDEDLAELKRAQAVTLDTFDPIFGLELNTKTGEKIPYYKNYAKTSDEWVDPDLTVPGTEAAAGDDWVSPVPPDVETPPTTITGPDGDYIVGGEVDLEEEDEKDANRYNKPTNLKYWNTAAVGARVLVIADPENNGSRWMYTVVSITEDGNIIYDEGEPVALDADQYTGAKVDESVGIPLCGGHDGDFQEITVNGVTRSPNAAEMKLLLSREFVKAFRGEKDRKILSPARVNLDFIFDANYNMTSDGDIETQGPVNLYSNSTILTDSDNQILSVIGGSSIGMDLSDLNVKKAIYDLNEFRNRNGMTLDTEPGAGCSIYLDCNLTGLNSLRVSYELMNIINMMDEFDGRATSIDLGYYEIFDPISGKRIKVTVTYFIAKNLVPHLIQYGINKPFVYNFATISALQRSTNLVTSGEMIQDSFRPTLDLIDWDVKEELYKSRINYWVTINNGSKIQRAVQNTRQREASALLEENNVRVLNTLKKGLEAACRNYLYEWNSPEVRRGYTTAQMDVYRPWIGKIVEELDIRFEANEFEQERMMMHCYCDVKFRDIVKRIILEINIQRPEYQLES